MVEEVSFLAVEGFLEASFQVVAGFPSFHLVIPSFRLAIPSFPGVPSSLVPSFQAVAFSFPAEASSREVAGLSLVAPAFQVAAPWVCPCRFQARRLLSQVQPIQAVVIVPWV